jgi:hypothetical protein
LAQGPRYSPNCVDFPKPSRFAINAAETVPNRTDEQNQRLDVFAW